MSARSTCVWKLAALSVLLAGCATTGSLGSAAHRLDRSAHHFYEEVHAGRSPGHTAHDAARLAEATRDFSRAVDRTRSRDELRFVFDRVAERYHHVRGQMDRPGSRQGDDARAFERVTDAYLDVDRVMNHPESRYHE